MPRTRRIFGPLTYGTLALAVLACVYSAYLIHEPVIDDWLRLRAEVEALGSDDPQVRTLALRALDARPSHVARPHLLAMVSDRRPEARAEALAVLARQADDPVGSARIATASAGDPEPKVRAAAASALGHGLAHWRLIHGPSTPSD